MKPMLIHYKTRNLFAINSNTIWFSFAIFARFYSQVTADLSYLILGLFALGGRSNIVKSLTFSWFFSQVSSGIAPIPQQSNIGRYFVLFCAAFSLIFHKKFKNAPSGSKNTVFVTLLFGLTLLIHSFLLSNVPDISVLKSISWFLTFHILLTSWLSFSTEESNLIYIWILNFLLIVLITSLPFIFIRSIGYMRNDIGFQGVLNQPQAFGPTMAMLSSLLVRWMILNNKINKRDFLYLLLAIFLIFLSKARTAIFAFFISLIFSFLILPFSTKSSNLTLSYNGVKKFKLLSVFLIIISILFLVLFPQAIEEFLSKDSEQLDIGIIDAYQVSRGVKIEMMLSNISKFPFTGIGFGIDSEISEMIVERDPVFNLPIGASIEKGVMPLAMLEELGYFGFFIFIIWILYIYIKAFKFGISSFMLVSTVLLLNLGESFLFSIGGLGLLSLILLTMGISMPGLQNKE
jgi:hypothetical protein